MGFRISSAIDQATLNEPFEYILSIKFLHFIIVEIESVIFDDLPSYALGMYLSVLVLAFIFMIIFVKIGMKFDYIKNMFIVHEKNE